MLPLVLIVGCLGLLAGSHPDIAKTLHLSDAQVEAVARYIEAHKDALMAVHRQIEARKARGNSPDINAKLAKSRTKLQEWLKQQHETKTVALLPVTERTLQRYTPQQPLNRAETSLRSLGEHYLRALS